MSSQQETKTVAGSAGLALRDLAFALGIAVLSWEGGTPLTAVPAVVAGNLVCTWALRRDVDGPLSRMICFTRAVPKAVQFLAIALFVTALFALERQVDLVPNTFGFLELVVPTILAAIFFDASGGLFCAVLIALLGFQIFAPPRFEAILDISTFALTLVTFSAVSLLSALHYSAATATRTRLMRLPDEWVAMRLHGASLVDLGHQRFASALALVRRQLLPITLVFAYALVWSTFAWLSSGNGLHVDSLEAYAWGREFVLGYYKHPPFWAWIAGLWFSIVPKSDWAFWFLSEFNAALGLAGVWVVMGRFCDHRTRLLALFMLMLTPFYQFNAQRFNANTILLSIWPWTVYFFIRSVETTRIIYAVACGLLAGCALLSKYFGVILIGTCFVAALTHDSRARYFRSAAPYVSGIVAALVFSPHVLWMVRNGFQPLSYLAEKIDLADRHISNSYFTFIGANVLFFLVPALVLVHARWRHGRQSHRKTIAVHNGPSFLSVLAVAPFILTLLAGTLGHAALAVPFGVPIFGLVPLCLVLLMQVPVEPAIVVARRLVIALTVTCLLASPFLPGAFLRWGGAGYADPRNEVADAAIALWHETQKRPLRFVSGDRFYSLAVTFRSPDDTTEFNEFSLNRSPRVTLRHLRDDGLLIICPQTSLLCLENARGYSTPQTVQVTRTLSRRIGSVTGRPVTFEIFVVPPA